MTLVPLHAPNFIQTKREKMKMLKLRGKTAQLKDPKTWPSILLTVQYPYVASHCTPYTELNAFFHTVNTTIAVNNPCLQY